MKVDVNRMRENLVQTRSWEPMEYSGWQDENISWKKDCDIGDWSQMVEYRVSGPDALKFFSDFAVNDFSKFEMLQAKHAIFCSKKGYVIGEGIVIRFGEDDFEFQSGGPVWSWLDFNCKSGSYDLICAEKRDDKFKFQVSGPKSLYLLEEVTNQNLRDIKFMHISKAKILDVEVDMLRQGMSGEIGFEIQGPKEHSKLIYDYIYEKGQPYSIRRIGGRTAMVKHMEASFPTVVHDYLPALTGEAEQDYWNEYRERFDNFSRFLKVSGSFEGNKVEDWFRNPCELGWSNRINLEHDFYGKEAIASIKSNPQRKLVTLIWNPEDVASIAKSMFLEEVPFDYFELPRTQWYSCRADKVLADGKVVGIATNRCFSYFFRETISHCSIDIDYSDVGKEVAVVWGNPGSRQKSVRAKVAPSPYKSDARYTDLNTLPTNLAEKDKD